MEESILLLKKGLKHLIKNKEVTIKNNIIVIKDNNFKLKSKFELPFSNTRFNLFFLNRQKKNIEDLNLLLADTKTFTIDSFCINNLIHCKTENNLENFIKNQFGNHWTLNTIKPIIRQKQTSKKKIKPKIKNLLWTFLYIDLKLFNPEFNNSILLEYIRNNIEKRNIESILKQYYKKISS